ncbi:MAG: isochorismatase family protein [Rhodobiaceae bacterium]|nr:isochorismatase family protein [Rhodobiaceae bacterium]
MILEAERTQLVAVDIQERLLPAMSEMRQVVERTELIGAATRRLDIPTTISEQYPRGLGHTYSKVHQALGNEARIFEKMHFSCMRDPELGAHIADLREAGRNQAVIIGIETHVCVAQTALDMKAQGFEVAVIVDACSSRRKDDKLAAIERFRDHGIEIITTEMAVFEWLERAGTDDFRAMAPLIK